METAQKKPLAIFDIDGTIFRSSLLIELTKALVHFGVFPKRVRTQIETKEQRWMNRKGSYETYIREVIVVFSQRLQGVLTKDVRRISGVVIKEHKDRVYTYTRDLLTKLRKTHRLVAISGSPSVIVKKFQSAWKFDDVFGTQYEAVKGVYTGKILSIASKDKKGLLETYCATHGYSLSDASLGVGDTESDISFLHLVKNPIAFNPNAKLLKVARQKKWKIVVERKDVVYTI